MVDLPWLMLILALLLLFVALKYMVDSLKVIVVSRATPDENRLALSKRELKGFLEDTSIKEVLDWVGIKYPIIVCAKQYLELLKLSK